MLDFYADWCVSCKEMEAQTFVDPAVRAKLDKAVLLRADVTANSDDDQARCSSASTCSARPASSCSTPKATSSSRRASSASRTRRASAMQPLAAAGL